MICTTCSRRSILSPPVLESIAGLSHTAKGLRRGPGLPCSWAAGTTQPGSRLVRSHRQLELANTPVGCFLQKGGGIFEHPRPVLAKQRPQPLLGSIRVPRQIVIATREAERSIPAVLILQPHEDQRHARWEVARGNRPDVILVDLCHAAAGRSRLAPHAAPRVGAQKLGHIGNRPVASEDASLGVRSGDRRFTHRRFTHWFDDPTSASAARARRALLPL